MENVLVELTRRIVCSLVDRPDAVELYLDDTDDRADRILIRTAPGELGQVIGRQGQNLEALRVVLQGVAGKQRRGVEVELLES